MPKAVPAHSLSTLDRLRTWHVRRCPAWRNYLTGIRQQRGATSPKEQPGLCGSTAPLSVASDYSAQGSIECEHKGSTQPQASRTSSGANKAGMPGAPNQHPREIVKETRAG